MTPLPQQQPFFTAAQMREADRRAIEEYGIPSLILMEHAARASADAAETLLARKPAARILILCGTGNNAGDGFACARLLKARGHAPTVLTAFPPDKLKGDAAANFKLLTAFKIPVVTAFPTNPANPAPDLIIDALFGTGLSRPVTGAPADLIKAANTLRSTAGIPLLALDIPSGISADTGQPPAPGSPHIRADATVTFGGSKPGLHLSPGREAAGTLSLDTIGFPPELAAQPTGIALNLPAPLPTRPADGHKGTFGSLLIVAGSRQYPGAALLALRAARAAGPGYIHLAAPASLIDRLLDQFPELIYHPLPETAEGTITGEASDILKEVAARCDAAVIGPGLSQNRETAAMLEDFLPNLAIPHLVDADALTMISKTPVTANRIITPHPGEASRLLGISTAAVQADRLAAARTLSARFGCIAVLKGAATIIARPDGTARINTTGNPGMGTAGSGDVLAGFIGGLLAERPSAVWDCACQGVWRHGLAGDKAAGALGERTMGASDLVGFLGD